MPLLSPLATRVYQCHPLVVGLPTSKRDLYNPPPLDRKQVLTFSNAWGKPIKAVPPAWGPVISPLLLAIHLEVEGSDVSPQHTNCIIQYLLWKGGDTLLMWHIHIAKLRPTEIPRRTFYWYMQKYAIGIADVQKLGMIHSSAKGTYVWTLHEVREALIHVDTFVLECYRLAYLQHR